MAKTLLAIPLIACFLLAATLQAQPTLQGISSDAHESCPVQDVTQQFLFFSRSGHSQNMGSANRADIWVATKMADGGWSHATNLGALVNSTADDYPVALLQNNTQLYLSSNRSNADFPMLYRSRRKDKLWSLAEPVVIDDHYSYRDEVSYAISFDGRDCLLSAERDEGAGGLDIFVSTLLEEAHYGVPEPLQNLNTDADESHPCLSTDGKTLYFMRTRADQTNLWMSRKLGNDRNSWSEPELVKLEENLIPEGIYIANGSSTMLVTNTDNDISVCKIIESQLPKHPIVLSGAFKHSENYSSNVTLVVKTGNDKIVAIALVSSSAYQLSLPYTNEDLYIQVKADGHFPVVKFVQHSDDFNLNNETLTTEFNNYSIKGNDQKADEISRQIHKIEAAIDKLEGRRIRQHISKQNLFDEIGLQNREDKTLIELRNKFNTAFDVEKQESALAGMKTAYKTYVSSGSGNDDEKGSDELSDMKDAYARYTHTNQNNSSQSETKVVHFDEVLATAKTQVLNERWLKYIEKQSNAVVSEKNLDFIALSSDVKFDNKDWQEISGKVTSHHAALLHTTNVTASLVTEKMQDIYNELTDYVNSSIGKKVNIALSNMAEEEAKLTFEEQVLNMMKSKLQKKLESKLMQNWEDSERPLTRKIEATPKNVNRYYYNIDIPLFANNRSISYELKGIHFEGSTVVLAANSIKHIRELSKLLIEAPELNLTIHAAVNSSMDDSYARALTGLRAQHIKKHLLEQGIVSKRIRTEAIGNSDRRLLNGQQYTAILSFDEGRVVKN